MYLIPESVSWAIRSRFNLDGEANFPTWFSSTLLISVSIFSLLVYYSNNIDEKSNAKTLQKHFWFFFSAVYCFLSLDETAKVHELAHEVLHVKWVYVYAPFAGAFFLICAYYIIIIRNNESRLRNWILGGLIVFAVGGMGAELISHIFKPLPILLQVYEIMFEEGLEMIGTIMVLIGCLKELSSKSFKIGEKFITIQ